MIYFNLIEKKDDMYYMTEKGTSISSSSANSWQGIIAQATMFVELTFEHVLQGLNPGGVYQAIWCRDASYILADWFLSGNFHGALQQIYQIWDHQIAPNREKIVYGRGSPDLKFSANAGGVDIQKKFEGALPTTIYQVGFSEVYGKNPDIDSTALMIGTSSFILARAPGQEKSKEGDSLTSSVASEHSADYVTSLLSKIGITDPSNVIEFVVPRMLKAVEYLESRDIDNDGLLEQGHNEDWMDTALRAGKIVYSQGCWIYGLIHLSVLLSKLGKSKEATRISRLAEKAIDAVNQKLWSKEDGTYIDIVQGVDSSSGDYDKIYRLLTQDVTYFLIAITANTVNDSFKDIVQQQQEKKLQEQGQEKYEPIKIPELHHQRAISTLDAIKKRVWKDKWPLVTEGELPKTGPWPLKPYQYHNHTFWPWTTGIEMLARSRFNQVEECNILLSKLTSKDKKSVGIHTFYEWINPITDEGGGAYPFRTGISTLRLSIVDLVQKIRARHYIQ